VPVPEKDLPVLLPNVKSYKPTDSGESPLADIASFVNVKCPLCKGKAKRETDVMPNWAGSSWYFLRYTDPKNKKTFAGKQSLKYWVPVDWYNGGMEHTVLHLLYSRFWHKFLYDLKLVPTKEPYKKRTAHGLVLASGGTKMSKSKGNIINPDSIVKLLGADTLRHFEMFMGPFDQAIAWNTDAVAGSRRFLERVWRLSEKVKNPPAGGKKAEKVTNKNLETLFHQTIKKVSLDIEDLKMNTALSQLMILLNAFEKEEKVPRLYFEAYLRLLAPFAPHMTEELWAFLGEKSSIHLEPWPKWDEKKLQNNLMTLPVQINGKVRATVMITRGLSDDHVEGAVLAHPDILKYVAGKKIKRVIYIPERIINILM
jgi:leucyl-tRNA synthetase